MRVALRWLRLLGAGGAPAPFRARHALVKRAHLRRMQRSSSNPTQELASRVQHDPYAALRVGSFRWYLAGNTVAMLGMQMQSVALGWEIYERTQSKLALGLVGLVQWLPVALLSPITGHVADSIDRK